MENTISEARLAFSLFSLKETMLNKDMFIPEQLEFLNSKSFYWHFATKPCGGTTVEEILTSMESCIPLALQEKSLQLFLAACKDDNPSRLRQAFMDSSRGDFLQLIDYTKNDPQKWEEVVFMCQALRQKNHSQP